MNQESGSLPTSILWFAPTAGLWPSSELENALANAWSDEGIRVTLIRCRGILNSLCSVMTSEGIRSDASKREKSIACIECNHNRVLLDSNSNSNYETIFLDDFVTKQMFSKARQVVSGTTHENWKTLEFMGMPIGRFSAYVTLLNHKVQDPTSTKEAWNELKLDLFNAILVAQALPVVFDELHPQSAAVYNPLYAVNRVFFESAIHRGIPMINMGASGFIPDRYSGISMYSSLYSIQTARESKSIAESMKVPLSQEEIDAVAAHSKQLMLGLDPWVYSSSPAVLSVTEIRTRLNLREASKVIVVLVSSPDEPRTVDIVEAGHERSKTVKSDTFEFIEECIQVARSMPENDFVIRLHPRLAPNARETISSPDLIRMGKILEDCANNVSINFPGDGLGLYDVIRIASVGLNHASSTGLEFMLFGIPVVHYDPVRIDAYPPDFGYFVERKNIGELRLSLEQALNAGWSLNNSRLAYRWLGTTLLRTVVHRRTILELIGRPDHEINASSEQPGPRLGSTFKRLIPVSTRRSISRKRNRRSRNLDFLNKLREKYDDSPEWKSESVSRLRSLGVNETWEPLVIPRGVPLSIDDESMAIGKKVDQFMAQLGGTELYFKRID
jgi:hypothetical protein